MEFNIACPCGNHITVTEGSAEATVACSCGRPLLIPSLKELRIRAGLPAHHVSPELVIEHLLATGEVPSDGICARCGGDTEDVIQVVTECEGVFVRRSGASPLVILILLVCSIFLLLPMPFLLLWLWRRSEIRSYGREKIYRLPVNVCVDCQRQLDSQSTIKQCLRRIPIYDQLLEKFPDTKVRVAKRRTGAGTP